MAFPGTRQLLADDAAGFELVQRLGRGASTDGGWNDAPAPAAPAGGEGRVAPPVVFLDLDDVGAVHVASAKSAAAQMYGGCRAIMRHEPTVARLPCGHPGEHHARLATVSAAPEHVDPALAALVKKVDQSGIRTAVTLLVRGVVVSGTLISAHDYFKGAGQGQSVNPGLRSEFETFHSALFHPGPATTDTIDAATVESARGAYVHLGGATVAGAPVQLWRGRLDAIDAFGFPETGSRPGS